MSDQRQYEQKLLSWERERERQKVEFTITEKDPDADLRVPSPEVGWSSISQTCLLLSILHLVV